jgi:predicted Ser/Thr protein kinase
MATDSRIGSTIAGYRIERLLGRGGMSFVYLAEQGFPRRRAALKLLAPELAEDPGFRERFIRESNAAASLDHPNVIPIYGAGDEEGVLWIAMRYVEGEDLARLIERDGPLSLKRTVSIVSQVAQALDAAHRQGLVHRDVKPSNVLIGEGDHAYLTDFGLIKRRDAATGFTKTGQFLGSVDYAAPEQIEGGTVDARSDVYSLGCLMYECLTGEPPFPRDSEVAVLYAHLNEQPAKVTSHRPQLPVGTDAVLAKAMAKNRDDRFSSTGDLAAAAQELRGRTDPIAAPRPRRVPAALAIGIVAAAIVAGAVTLVAVGHKQPGAVASQEPPPSTSGPTSTAGSGPPVSFPLGVVDFDLRAHKVLAATPLHVQPQGTIYGLPVAAGEGGIWTLGTNSVAHLDPVRGTVLDTIPVAGFTQLSHLALGPGAVWVSGHPGLLVRIDPATDEIVRRWNLRGIGGNDSVTGVEPIGDAVWLSDSGGGLTRIDVGTDRAGPRRKTGAEIDDLAYGDGRLWAVDAFDGVLLELDPHTGDVDQTIDVPGSPNAVAAGLGLVYILNSSSGTVVPVDPDSGQLREEIRVGESPSDITVAFGAVWVANRGDGTLSRIDPGATEAVTIPVGLPMVAIVPDPHSRTMWMTFDARA